MLRMPCQNWPLSWEVSFLVKSLRKAVDKSLTSSVEGPVTYCLVILYHIAL